MLELSLSGGGLWGMAMSGFLYGLRDRGVTPEVVTAVSSGAHAGYLIYSGGDYDSALRWFQLVRNHMSSRPISRFLPPYDFEGETIGLFTRQFLVDPSVFTDNGVRHFLVGYVHLKGFRFVSEDILPLQPELSYRVILRSSTIPFLTNFVPHFDGCVDGGFKCNAFVSDLPATERWLITYAGMQAPAGEDGHYQRQILLPRLSRNAFFANDKELAEGFEQGYAIAAGLAFG